MEIDSDMEDNQIEQILSKKLEEEQVDNLLAYTAERMLHGGGTPPTATDNIPTAHSTTLTVPQILFYLFFFIIIFI